MERIFSPSVIQQINPFRLRQIILQPGALITEAVINQHADVHFLRERIGAGESALVPAGGPSGEELLPDLIQLRVGQ